MKKSSLCPNCMEARIVIKIHPKNILATKLTPATKCSGRPSGIIRVYCRKGLWVKEAPGTKELIAKEYRTMAPINNPRFSQGRQCNEYVPDE